MYSKNALRKKWKKQIKLYVRYRIEYLGANLIPPYLWLRALCSIWFSVSEMEFWLFASLFWLATSEEAWLNILPLILASEISGIISGWHRRAATTMFARSLILTMRRMQQSKYKEVTAPRLGSWTYATQIVTKIFL